MSVRPAIPILLVTLCLPHLAAAQAFLHAADPTTTEVAEPMPLTKERLTVRIDRQYAESTLTQTFSSKSDVRLEGRYALSLGEGAKVSGFAYWNGKRKIVGEVFEKEIATQVYGEITGTGRDPGLFEQVGEGAFTFRVFPIEPREDKQVEVRFGRYLPLAGDSYEYRLPLGNVDADVAIELADDRDIVAVESTTHQLIRTGNTITTHGPGDLVLKVKLKQPALKVHAAVHRDANQDAYVVVSMTAPDAATTAVVPKDVTLVIDHSGSMQGAPMEHALLAAAQVIEKLRPTDRVNVIIFDDGVDTLYATAKPVTDAVRAEALAYVAAVKSDGGTDIGLALTKAFAAQVKDDRPDVVLFLTDGQSDAPAALAIAKADQGDTRVFTIGLGQGVEKPLLAMLAAEKRGAFTFIADEKMIQPGVMTVFERVDRPVMVDLAIDGAQRMYPRTLPDLARGEELVVAARLPKDGTITVSGLVGGKRVERTIAIALPAAERRAWVGRMWAGARVEDLLQQMAIHGETEELKTEAIELALSYNLVTPFTSFLALPEEEMTEGVAQTIADARARKQAIRAAHPDAAALSRDDMPPGDPVLSVRAPKTATQVTAYFPFGLTKDLEWDTHDEQWKLRFLVPKGVADGLYTARVVIVHADGTVEIAQAPYKIDASEPDFVAETAVSPGGVLVTVTTQGGIGGVIVGSTADASVRVTLVDVGGGVFVGVLPLGPGRHDLRVVVADTARNEADQLLTVEVK